MEDAVIYAVNRRAQEKSSVAVPIKTLISIHMARNALVSIRPSIHPTSLFTRLMKMSLESQKTSRMNHFAFVGNFRLLYGVKGRESTIWLFYIDIKVQMYRLPFDVNEKFSLCNHVEYISSCS